MSETSGGHIVGRQGIHPEEHGVLRLLQLVQEGLVGGAVGEGRIAASHLVSNGEEPLRGREPETGGCAGHHGDFAQRLHDYQWFGGKKMTSWV